jgi:methylglutaconyl-CoA hydratase
MNPDKPISESQAYDDAVLITRMYQAIDECPCPVIGCVQGSVFGGGVGLVAVCDIVIAAENTMFALSEVKLGLMPAVISPFLLRKAGESFLRRYCLTGEPFSALVAKHFNLVHDVIELDGFEKHLAELIAVIRRLAPQAVRNTKALFRRILPLHGADRWTVCAQANAQGRLSSEAIEGLNAFLEKRVPAWATTE